MTIFEAKNGNRFPVKGQQKAHPQLNGWANAWWRRGGSNPETNLTKPQLYACIARVLEPTFIPLVILTLQNEVFMMLSKVLHIVVALISDSPSTSCP